MARANGDRLVRRSTQPVAPRSLLASGHFKLIEQVRPNDRVLSRDQHGRTIAYQPVEETYRRTSYHLRHLTFQSASGTSHQTQTLQTTDEHPFWNASIGTFTDAGKPKVGGRAAGPDGQLQALASTERTEYPEGVPVFNFRVADYHTYYAAAPGGVPVLVHNADYPSRVIDRIGDLTTTEANALKKIWGGFPRSSLSLRTREQLANLYSGVANRNVPGTAQAAFNQARANYLLGGGPNPGTSVNDFAERMGLPKFRR